MPRAKRLPGVGTTQSEVDRLQVAFFQEQRQIAKIQEQERIRETWNPELSHTPPKRARKKPTRALTLRSRPIIRPQASIVRGEGSEQCVQHRTRALPTPAFYNEQVSEMNRNIVTVSAPTLPEDLDLQPDSVVRDLFSEEFCDPDYEQPETNGAYDASSSDCSEMGDASERVDCQEVDTSHPHTTKRRARRPKHSWAMRRRREDEGWTNLRPHLHRQMVSAFLDTIINELHT